MRQTRLLLERAAAGPLPDWDALAPSFRLGQFGKGADVFAEGEWQPFVYVMRRGLVKLSYFNGLGDEWIKSFIGDGDFFACPNVLLSGGKTDYSAVALEESEIEQVDYVSVLSRR